MNWFAEFFQSFKEHLIEEIKVGDIGGEINEAILQWKGYLTVGDFRLMITDAIIVTWIAVTLIILIFGLMSRKAQLKPNAKQTFVEMIISLLISTETGFGMNEKEAWHVAPMLGTFALMITGCNVISIFDIAPPAKNIAFPVTMALVAIFYVCYASIRFVGFKGFWLSLTTPMPALLPFKVLDMIIKPCSLALRLFGNVFGAFVFMDFIHVVIPVVLPGILGLWFDLADGVLQAVVFTYLTASYIGEIVEIGHEYQEHPEEFEKKKKTKKNKNENETASAAA